MGLQSNPNQSTLGNEYVIQKILNVDNLFNCTETERIQNPERKIQNQACLNQEDTKNINNASKQKCDTKSQKEEVQQNYFEYNKEKMENVQNIFPNLPVTQIDDNS